MLDIAALVRKQNFHLYLNLKSSRICGMIFNIIAAQTAHASICSFTVPFKVRILK